MKRGTSNANRVAEVSNDVVGDDNSRGYRLIIITNVLHFL